MAEETGFQRKESRMSEKSGKTRATLDEKAYEEWEKIDAKDTGEMTRFLREHTDLDDVEGMVDAKDNIEFIVRKHPEIIDRRTPTDKLVEDWEKSVEQAFPPPPRDPEEE